MLDTRTPGSPGWWFSRLSDKQQNRLPTLHRLHRYYMGDADLPEGHKRAREAFAEFQRRARSNYTGLVAESVIERLEPVGFQAGSDAVPDAHAWQIWRANRMDADIRLGLRAAVSMGESYLMVGPPDGTAASYPVITAEDPREMVVEMDPIRKRRAVAALKEWVDPVAGERRAVLLLPDATHSFRAPLTEGQVWHNSRDWEPAGSVANHLGVVPVVRLPNRMDLFGETRSEFADVMDIQDRINSQILDRLVMSKMQAYRQRWVKGTSLTDEDGKPIDLTPGADLLWAFEDPETELGEFQQSDIRPILQSVQDDVRDLAAISRTPPHYLMAEFTNAGGDAFAQSETGHVAKVRERMSHYGEAIEDALRLAYAYLGDPRSEDLDMGVIWADPQYRSLAEKADAAVKLGAAGVPWRTLMQSVLDYAPDDVARMERERASDALTTFLGAATPETTQSEPS